MKVVFFILLSFLLLIKGLAQPLFSSVYSPNGQANVGADALCGAESDTIYLMGGGYYNPYFQQISISKVSLSGEVLVHNVLGYQGRNNGVPVAGAIKSTSDYIYYTYHSSDSINVIRSHFVKAKKNGDILWERTFVSNKRLDINDFKQQPDGSFILAGKLDDGTGVNVLNQSLFLIKADSNGIEYERLVHTLQSEDKRAIGISVYQAADGSYIVGGHSEIYPQNSTSPYSSGLFVKFKLDGTKTVKSVGDYWRNEWHSGKILRSNDGNLIIPSMSQHDSYPYGGGQLGIYNHTVPALIKMDENLNIIWQKELDTAYMYNYYVYKGVNSLDGNMTFIGNYLESNEELQYPMGRGALIKADQEGNRIWKRTFHFIETNTRNDFNDIIALPDGGYFICGTTKDMFGISGSQQDKFWLLRTDSYGCLVPGCQYLDVEENQKTVISIKAYPNPTTDNLYIYNGSAETVKGTVVDITGKIIIKYFNLPKNSTTILPFFDLPKGIYILSVTKTNGAVYAEKIIKN